MVKDHSDNDRGRDLLYAYPTDMTSHTMAFVIPIVEHWLEQKIAQLVYNEGSIQ